MFTMGVGRREREMLKMYEYVKPTPTNEYDTNTD